MADEYTENLRSQLSELSLSNEEKDTILEVFIATDEDKSGFIETDEIYTAFSLTSAKPPKYKIREAMECQKKYDTNKDNKLSIAEFSKIYTEVCPKSMKNTFEKAIQKKSGIIAKTGSKASAEGTQHSYSVEERVAFCNWINQNLVNDPDLAPYNLPLNEDDEELFFNSLKDGIILCKLINFSQPDTIDRRAINLTKKSEMFQIHKDQENLNLALNSASAIGCSIVNIGAEDIKAGRAHLIMGMLWQVIRIGLFAAISLEMRPELAVLLRDGEDMEDLQNLTPEELLLRWMNYHLDKSDSYKNSPKEGKEIENFSGDIKDSYAYLCLLEQICPEPEDPDEDRIYANVNKYPGNDRGVMVKRANQVLNEADKIDCRAFVSPEDIVKGNTKLNMAFVANLFNKYPALEPREPVELEPETREEKTYRNWMNSMGVSPRVNRIHKDLRNGLALCKLFQIVNKDIVDESKIQTNFSKLGGNMKKIENCNYAVELGKKCNFSLVGIDGNDISSGNHQSNLAISWQLMRAYTLSMLKDLMGPDEDMKKIDAKIIEWANSKLDGKCKTIGSFKDPNLTNSAQILTIIDAISEKVVDFSAFNPDSEDEEVKLDNAKYAISMARRIGARVYALPEDIVEPNAKMMMTLFACLMTRDYAKSKS